MSQINVGACVTCQLYLHKKVGSAHYSKLSAVLQCGLGIRQKVNRSSGSFQVATSQQVVLWCAQVASDALIMLCAFGIEKSRLVSKT